MPKKKKPDFVHQQGDNSTAWSGTLKDRNGAVNLTGYDLDLITTLRGDETRVIDVGEATLTILDQGTNLGGYSYTFTTAQAANAVGDYDASFKGTDASGDPITFPTHWDSDEEFLWYKIADSL